MAFFCCVIFFSVPSVDLIMKWPFVQSLVRLNYNVIEGKEEKGKTPIEYMITEQFQPKEFTFTGSPDPQRVQGVNDTPQPSPSKTIIDPYAKDRTPVDNYRLLVSSIVPRPIALVSTLSPSGEKNLAPFSYFQLVNSDPPIFVIGISQGKGVAKDTVTNLLHTEECTVNIMSEWFVEAANQTCIDAPAGRSEWEIAGLTEEKSTHVKPSIVQESAFSIECKLVHHHDWFSKSVEGRKTGTLCILEGVLFHARTEVLNDDKNSLDIGKLKPVSRLGGNTYGRVTEGFDIPRAVWEQ